MGQHRDARVQAVQTGRRRSILGRRMGEAEFAYVELVWWQRYPGLVIEAFVLTSVAVLIPVSLATGHEGFFALFLTAASCAMRLDALIVENRELIYTQGLPSIRANWLTATSIVAIFLGICSAYLTVGIFFPSSAVSGLFDFAYMAGGLGEASILDRHFGDAGRLAGHNLAVMATVVIFALVYRSYGVMLVVAWNACVWTFVLTELTQRALPEAGADLGMTASFAALVMVAVLPHLVLEASAYVVAALAGIYLSKAMVKYGARDSAMQEIVQVASVMVLVSAVVLVFAGLVEATWPSLVLSWVR